MHDVLRRRALSGIAAVLFLAGCALPGSQGAGTPQDSGVRTDQPAGGWQFGAREHVDLWYHGLGFVLPPIDSLPLPIYDRAERDRALAAARSAGVSRTPLELAADSIAREFAGSSTYERLQFVPLYFENTSALFDAIRVWQQAEGNPQAAGSQQGARAVALLNDMFDTPRLRRWVAEFARVLEAERSAYYGAYWRQRESQLRPLADAAARDWATLQPALERLLRFLQLSGGQVLLAPSLGGEGRTVQLSSGLRSAVGPGTAAEDVVHALVHELMYSMVGDVVRDNVAPAKLRDLGEEPVTSSAAVRAGVLVLERLEPGRVDGYRRYYLRAAGRTGSGDAAFRAAFPLPPELESALPRAVDQALAGI
jgi:hypothetical protein